MNFADFDKKGKRKYVNLLLLFFRREEGNKSLLESFRACEKISFVNESRRWEGGRFLCVRWCIFCFDKLLFFFWGEKSFFLCLSLIFQRLSKFSLRFSGRETMLFLISYTLKTFITLRDFQQKLWCSKQQKKSETWKCEKSQLKIPMATSMKGEGMFTQ